MSKKNQEFVFLPLGGMGEIGMNMYCYGFGPADDRRWLMVDCGVKFGTEAEPGIDVILPDVRFLEGERLLGIILTHAHEDHHGALPWLWHRLKAPIYCSPFAAELVKHKFSEHGILKDATIHVRPAGSRFEIGPFDIEMIAVTHSIPEPNAIMIRTSLGNALHSGDWKIDNHPSIPPRMDEESLKAIGDEGLDALICDSTNVLREGFSPSEREISANLAKLIKQAPARVAITTFASHVGRITSIAEAARATGREIVVAGRAMRTVIEAARNVGLLAKAGQFLNEDALGYLPPERTLLLCTGSQGEPRAAIARIAAGTHPSIELDAGDWVIFSSKIIPGNEHAVGAILNNLAMKNIRSITSDDELVHTSGHPRQDELKTFYGWVRPKLLVPMHGEQRHLHFHADFARAQGIAKTCIANNGDILRLSPGEPEIIDEAPSGRLHVDGRLIVPSVDGPARERRKLSFAGLVVCTLVVDEKGQLISGPNIFAQGLPPETAQGEDFIDYLMDSAENALDGLPRARKRDDNAMEEALRSSLRRAADLAWGKKPQCEVIVHRV